MTGGDKVDQGAAPAGAAQSCGGGRGFPSNSSLTCGAGDGVCGVSGADRPVPAPTFLGAALHLATAAAKEGRVLSLKASQNGVGAALVVLMTADEDAVIHAAIRQAWGFDA